MRPTMSVLPPGGNGTISLIGFAGYVCADTLPASSNSKAIALKSLFMEHQPS
jgi:hypothetical protein